MATISIHDVPEQRFFTGFFDKISESISIDNRYYLVGNMEADNLELTFFSNFYTEKKHINELIEAGDMLENGLLSGNPEKTF